MQGLCGSFMKRLQNILSQEKVDFKNEVLAGLYLSMPLIGDAY